MEWAGQRQQHSGGQVAADQENDGALIEEYQALERDFAVVEKGARGIATSKRASTSSPSPSSPPITPAPGYATPPLVFFFFLFMVLIWAFFFIFFLSQIRVSQETFP